MLDTGAIIHLTSNKISKVGGAMATARKGRLNSIIGITINNFTLANE